MSRIDKVNEEIRHRISTIVQQELSDPDIGFITITSVSVSPDLRHALVYFTSIGDDDKKDQTKEALEKARGYIRKLLGKNLRIKFTPDIKFVYDDTAQQEAKIDKLFDDIHKEGEPGE